MAVLVTGGAGYIGSHMVWALLDAGEDVVVIDRLSTGFRWAIPTEVRFYEGDIADAELLDVIFAENAIDSIIHFAGSIIVPESFEKPLDYYENNTAKSRSLIASAVKARIPHFVFSSTAAIYGVPESDAPVTEDMRPRPESPYGQSKLMTEIMLRDTSRAHDFAYTALRYFNVCGADPNGRTGQSTPQGTQLIKVACETALGKRSRMSVFGTDYPTRDGTCVRDYVHVSDLVDAHLKALTRMRNGGGSMVANCGYGTGFSVLEVLDAVRRLTGREIVVDYVGRRIGDAACVIANPALAKAEFNWVPQYDRLDTIVETALKWEEYLLRKNSV